jgi:hypothetical protein
MNLLHFPSVILQKALCSVTTSHPVFIDPIYLEEQNYIGSIPPTEGDWPMYSTFLPDMPDNAICIYDTQGELQGRSLRSGNVHDFFGVNIKVRSGDAKIGMDMCLFIQSSLDSLYRWEVDIPDSLNDLLSDVYVIQNASRKSSIMVLGKETGTDRIRNVFTLNYLLSIQFLGVHDTTINLPVST